MMRGKRRGKVGDKPRRHLSRKLNPPFLYPLLSLNLPQKKANPTNPANQHSLCADILRSYTHLDEETQQRNILAWRPTVSETLLGISGFPVDRFDRHVETFYPLAISLLERNDLGGPGNSELRASVSAFLRRVGEVRFGLVMMSGRVGGGSGSVGESSSAATTPLVSPAPEVGRAAAAAGFDWEGTRERERERRRGSRVGTATVADAAAGK